MNYFSKLLFVFSTIFFFNVINPVSLGELIPVQTSPSYRVIVGHVVDSSRNNKWPIPKSVSDPFVRRCISSSLSDYTYKAPSIIGPNERWTRDDFRTYFEQLFHNNPTLAKEIHGYGVPCYEFTAAGQQKILEQLPLYAYKEFRKFVAKFPEYPQFIRNLSHQVKHNQDFCRMVNPQLSNSHEFQTSNQWRDPAIVNNKQKPVTLFCRLKHELPPKNYNAKRIDGCQQKALQNFQNKQEFIDNSQQVLQDPAASAQQKEFAEGIQNAAFTTDGSSTTQKLDATPELLAAAQQQQLPKQEVEITYGDLIKHKVQEGLVACGNEAAQQKDPLSGDITNSAILGIEYNQAGFTHKALLIADLCYVANDYMRKFEDLTYECLHAAGMGIYDGMEKAYSMAMNPEQTIIDMAHGIEHLGYYVSKTLIGLADPIFTPTMLRSGDSYQKREQFVADLKQTSVAAAKEIIHTFMTTPTRELVRKAFAFGVEGWLTNRALLTLSSLFSKTGQLSAVVGKHIKDIAPGAEALEPVAAGIGKVEQPSRLQTWFNEIKDEIKGIGSIFTPGKVKRYISACGDNFEHLSKLYDGIVTFKDKLVRFNYKHFFGLEVEEITKQTGRIERTFSGFHHDYLGELENSGVVQLLNKQVCPKTGVIKADVVWNGVRQQKTLFPSHWTREQVVEKILEALNNNISINKLPNGTNVVTGITKEEIKITMFISDKGRISSAYPLFK